MNLILQALGIEVPANRETEIVKKILNDGFFMLKCQEVMIRAFAVEASRGLHPLEIASLTKRLGELPANPKPRARAHWGFLDHELTGGKGCALRAECQSCKNTIFIEAPVVQREIITQTNPKTGAVVSQREVVRPVTRAMVEATLDRCEWNHCGHVDYPGEDLMFVFADRLFSLVEK